MAGVQSKQVVVLCIYMSACIGKMAVVYYRDYRLFGGFSLFFFILFFILLSYGMLWSWIWFVFAIVLLTPTVYYYPVEVEPEMQPIRSDL